MWRQLFKTKFCRSVLGMMVLLTAQTQAAGASEQAQNSPAAMTVLESILKTGHQYLVAGKNSEARLASVEAETLATKNKFGLKETIRIALLKAESLLALDQEKDAQQAIDFIETQATSEPEAMSLKSDILMTRMKIKLHSCSHLGNPEEWASLWKQHPHDSEQEGQLIDQLKRRGICLEEALIIFRSAIESKVESKMGDSLNQALHQAVPSVKTAYQGYERACVDQKMKAGRFKSELQIRLVKDFRSALKRTVDLVGSWQKAAASSKASQTVIDGLNELSSSLKRQIERSTQQRKS